MNTELDESMLTAQRRDQMLRLVTKGFYRELVKYGVQPGEILQVASHLLDNLMEPGGGAGKAPWGFDDALRLGLVRDTWSTQKEISVGDVALKPLLPDAMASVLRWLKDPAIRACFVEPYPKSARALRQHFANPRRHYLAIHYGGDAVGFIGGEHVEPAAGKLEMKKCVGRADLRGRGIGKRATFAFLYYAFMVLGVHKVYIRSRDINIRNVNLNSRLGFEVEGILLEDALLEGHRQDVVRMALLRPAWLQAFAEAAPARLEPADGKPGQA